MQFIESRRVGWAESRVERDVGSFAVQQWVVEGGTWLGGAESREETVRGEPGTK